MQAMNVINRQGGFETVNLDKITGRLQKLTYGLSSMIDVIKIKERVSKSIFNNIKTTQLDQLAAEAAAGMATIHSDYSFLAARIEISNLYRKVDKRFSVSIEKLYKNTHPRLLEIPAPQVSKEVYEFVMTHKEELDSSIVHDRDLYDYFGFNTLRDMYLMRDCHKEIVERPQHMLMRVAVGIHLGNMPRILETYNLLSLGYFTHATPTLMNASRPNATLASCFLVQNRGDSIEDIFDTQKQYAMISKGGGGIGTALHNIRAESAYIKGSGGESAGLVPLLIELNRVAKYVDQSRKRNGAIAIYLEPWHADIFKFLDMRKNNGIEQERARDLFYALWIPDLFMKRVDAGGIWSLMSPDECPDLPYLYGDEFEAAYEDYEKRGLYFKQVPARDLWRAIIVSQVETGTPYMLYKDACNRKSNQKNLGTIQCSNLCVEIVQYSSKEEISVCTLASICLPMFVKESRFSKSTSRYPFEKLDVPKTQTPDGYFDHGELFQMTRVVVRNLNNVIDTNFYSVPEAQRSSLRNRPIGIGVQGLANVFQMLRLPYEAEAAQKLNEEIFETIYFAALTESCALAKELGPYESYHGSPVSHGLLQPDMWEEKVEDKRWNWTGLRKDIAQYGVRNSLLTALMPTAGTSQILGNTESFEPLTNNLYVRKTKVGEYTVVNRHLIADLESMNLWNEQTRRALLESKGSILNLPGIPVEIKELYKTVWEMKGKTIVNMSRVRAKYVDQSQSLNLHMMEPNYEKLTAYHFYTWRAGLKTGMYYLRTRQSLDAQSSTLDPTEKREVPAGDELEVDGPVCVGREDCLMCSS